VDMRNHYEREIGHFENAWTQMWDTFRAAYPLLRKKSRNIKG
jgi:UPF0176 protein